MGLLVVELNEQLLRDFRSFAVEKHGKLYGVLKPEVELALRMHLVSQKSGLPTLNAGKTNISVGGDI